MEARLESTKRLGSRQRRRFAKQAFSAPSCSNARQPLPSMAYVIDASLCDPTKLQVLITTLRRVSGSRKDRIFLLENCLRGTNLDQLTKHAKGIEVLHFKSGMYKKKRHLRYHMAITHKVQQDVVCLLRDDEKISTSSFWLSNALVLFRNNPRLGE
jgi:hypothetical protein